MGAAHRGGAWGSLHSSPQWSIPLACPWSSFWFGFRLPCLYFPRWQQREWVVFRFWHDYGREGADGSVRLPMQWMERTRASGNEWSARPSKTRRKTPPRWAAVYTGKGWCRRAKRVEGGLLFLFGWWSVSPTASPSPLGIPFCGGEAKKTKKKKKKKCPSDASSFSFSTLGWGGDDYGCSWCWSHTTAWWKRTRTNNEDNDYCYCYDDDDEAKEDVCSIASEGRMASQTTQHTEVVGVPPPPPPSSIVRPVSSPAVRCGVRMADRFASSLCASSAVWSSFAPCGGVPNLNPKTRRMKMKRKTKRKKTTKEGRRHDTNATRDEQHEHPRGEGPLFVKRGVRLVHY